MTPIKRKHIPKIILLYIWSRFLVYIYIFVAFLGKKKKISSS